MNEKIQRRRERGNLKEIRGIRKDGDKIWTRREAEAILSLKKTQTVQILGEMLDKGVLLKVGTGRSTSYIANV